MTRVNLPERIQNEEKQKGETTNKLERYIDEAHYINNGLEYKVREESNVKLMPLSTND